MASHRPMRQQSEREASMRDARVILDEGEFAVVSTVDVDGSPYGVPISYAMIDDRMYIHTGLGPGRKLDDFERDSRVCVTVAIDLEPLFIDSFFTTRYASVIAEGRISRVDDPVIARRALVALCMKYVPSAKGEIGRAIEAEWDKTSIWEISFDEVRAKAGRWLRGQALR